MSIFSTRMSVFGAVSLLAVAALTPSRAADLELKRFVQEQDRAGPAGAVGHTPLKGTVAKKRATGARR